ncbi:G-type lectin S-receptor-like serine/threonine-protein kinase At1g11410 isoform X2 [Prosopis cineraria]|nr:G-type lectin S-receptor-like serine/threonine-protein kinase At1g11410 isoform X2 [Prosopis cineraria]
MKVFSAKRMVLVSTLLLLLFLLHSSCDSLDRITPSQPLRDGDILLSYQATFALGFFTPSNNSRNRYVGIWFHRFSKQTLVWVANRENPVNDTSGVLSISAHGNMVVLALNDINSNLNPIWSSSVSITSSNETYFAKLLDIGNLVLGKNGGRHEKVLWQSFDYPTDTILPFMKLGLDRRTGFNWFLRSWRSPHDPRFGNMSHRINPTGYPQIFTYKNGTPFWRCGSWTGQRWSGIPVMTPNFVFNVSYVDNANEVSIMIGIRDPTIFLRMVLDNDGLIRRTIWQAKEHRWFEIWSGPTEDCDNYRRCGSNSICDPYTSNKLECVCLPGYVRNGSSGCVRKKNVSTCRNGEGFVKVALVKVPDTSTARVDKNMSLYLKGCEGKCLKDCSCVAYTSLNEVTQSGCLTWHADMEDIRRFNHVGQELYVRVDAAEMAKYEKKPYGSLGKRGMVALVVVSTFLLMFMLISFVYWFAKKKEQEQRRPSEHLLDGENNSDLPLFDLNDIVEATSNFSDANKLGQGGFGSVHKGVLNDGTTIAVKRLLKYSGQGIEEFKNEIALIAKLQHRNLVRILGCCIEGEEKMLIYEYLPNNSLDSFIFDHAKKLQLHWRKRFDIICGIARGILYLHQHSRLRIIHRDLKASNILLDSTLNPKIADFGMARIFGGDQIEASTNYVVGT